MEYRTKGAILRSKSRWCNEGEKNTEYFLNLEKRHFKQGTISQFSYNLTKIYYYLNVNLSIKISTPQK